METTTRIAEQQSSPGKLSFWPERILGPQPGLKELNLACWCLFVGFLVIPLGVVHWIQVRHGEGSAVQLRSDFVYLYGDGQIARAYPTPKIYDYYLQQRVFNAIHPPHDGIYGPSPYPPFIALFFEPFTYLSFDSAYLLWLGISLCLYLVGIMAIANAIFPGERLKISLLFCFALAFYPFLFSTLFNGQLAAVAMCSVGLAIHQESRGKPFRSGLALALLIYKFTLLPLILPMLLITRRYRTILGFATGAGILLSATTAIAGIKVWPAYVNLLRLFRGAASVSGPSRTQLWVHIDLNTCFAAIPGGRSTAGLAILTCITGVVLITLAVLLWRSIKANRPTQWLVWAAILTWTLLLNIYVPIYDSVLVVIAVVLTLGALRDLRWSRAAEWTTLLAVIIFLISWPTESFAKAHGVQLLSIALLVLGTVQLVFLRRAIRQELQA